MFEWTGELRTTGRTRTTPERDEREEQDRGTPIGRRVLLGMLGLGALGVVAAPTLQRGMESFLGGAADKDPTGLTGLLPNGGGFRYYSVTSSVPAQGRAELPPQDRRSRRPPDHLHAGRPARAAADPNGHATSSASRAGGCPSTPFEGVRLSRLLDAAGVRSSAGAVRFTCFDGAYTESLTLDQARRADVLVALRMQDKNLSHTPRRPGPPLRRPHVLLQVREVALRHHASPRTCGPATGRTAATTSTPGSADRTDATMSLRADAPRPPVRRYAASAAPRSGCTARRPRSWACAWLTAACLYVPQLAELVGRRELVVTRPRVVRAALPVPRPGRPGLPRPARRPAATSTASARTTGSGCAPPCAATRAELAAGRQVQRGPEDLRVLDRGRRRWSCSARAC